LKSFAYCTVTFGHNILHVGVTLTFVGLVICLTIFEGLYFDKYMYDIEPTTTIAMIINVIAITTLFLTMRRFQCLTVFKDFPQELNVGLYYRTLHYS